MHPKKQGSGDHGRTLCQLAHDAFLFRHSKEGEDNTHVYQDASELHVKLALVLDEHADFSSPELERKGVPGADSVIYGYLMAAIYRGTDKTPFEYLEEILCGQHLKGAPLELRNFLHYKDEFSYHPGEEIKKPYIETLERFSFWFMRENTSG